MTETYKSLLEHGISIAINDKIIEYHPTDDSMYRKLRDWKVSVAKQYSNISFEEQQSLVGLSKIVSNILEDSKAVYYATKAREIVERSQKDSFEETKTVTIKKQNAALTQFGVVTCVGL